MSLKLKTTKSMKIIDIIKKVFEAYGYIIKSSDISDFIAKGYNKVIYVKYTEKCDFEALKEFSDKIKNENGEYIYISDEFSEKLKQYADENNIILWDRNKLESWIGHSIVSGNLSKIEFSNSNKKKIETLSINSLPIKIDESESYYIAKTKIETVSNQKLKFVPIWYYKYSFDTKKEFKSKVIDLKGNGEGYVNAVTCENYFKKYTEITDNIPIPTYNYEIENPVLDMETAEKKAIEYIIKKNSKEVRINDMIGDTIVSENKIVMPDSENINIEMKLIYIPIWVLSNNKNIIEVNAYDRTVIIKNQNNTS